MTPSPAANLVNYRNHKRYFAFVALAALSVTFWWQPILSTIALAWNGDAYSHILLIVPLSLALIYLEPTRIAAADSRGIGVGAALLATAVLLRVFTIKPQAPSLASFELSLNMLALVTWWIGSAIACFGRRILPSHLFAFCFLFLSVPLPDSAVTDATRALQNGSAISSGVLFHAAGVPVVRHGVALSIPGLDIEVAKECSSIRSSTMLIIITLIFAHLFLRSRWRKILLVLMAIPLSIAKNAVRIFTIAELATRVDPGYLHGNLHHHGGVVFLSLAVGVTVLLLWILRKGELRSEPALSPQLTE